MGQTARPSPTLNRGLTKTRATRLRPFFGTTPLIVSSSALSARAWAPTRAYDDGTVTLILGMIKAEGIYLSADYRVTDFRTGKLVDDASIKLLTVHYPPDPTGPKALLGYSGLAVLPDGTPTGRWMRETLRGEAEFINDSMKHLRQRLDRDLAPLRTPFQVTVLATHGEGRYVGGFSNVRDPRRPFGYEMREMTKPFAFAHGSGGPRVAASSDLALLRSQLEVMPRKPLDHMRLLAAINRRAAAVESTVSRFCQVAFVNADERTSPTSHVFTRPGETVPFEMPMLLFGIDLTDMDRVTLDRLTALIEGEDPGESLYAEAMNESVKRRP